MNRKVNWNRVAQVVVVLLVALGLKQYYSTASANQLRWILAPTTLLVSLVSGETFQFESYAGYVTSDHTFVIAAACAGVNFLITAFLMLALRKLWVDKSAKVSWRFARNKPSTRFSCVAETAQPNNRTKQPCNLNCNPKT